MGKYVDKINKFLQSSTKTLNLRFNDGIFIELKKHVKNEQRFLEIHTPEYDGKLEINEALEWIKWTLYDYSANGFLA